MNLVNDTIQGNTATGTGGNPGNGGNGGGIYMDGAHIVIKMCGTHVDGNQGNAYGGGFFYVDDATAGTAVIDQSTFDGNSTAFAGGLLSPGSNRHPDQLERDQQPGKGDRRGRSLCDERIFQC